MRRTVHGGHSYTIMLVTGSGKLLAGDGMRKTKAHCVSVHGSWTNFFPASNVAFERQNTQFPMKRKAPDVVSGEGCILCTTPVELTVEGRVFQLPKPIQPDNFVSTRKDEQSWKQEMAKLQDLSANSKKKLGPVYFRQEHAFQASGSGETLLSEPTFVWSYERLEFNGGRRYLVCLLVLPILTFRRWVLILSGNLTAAWILPTGHFMKLSRRTLPLNSILILVNIKTISH
ncbi:hypothetical protein M1146_00170 [Patescibacteria group bacterium]|nr:hypothetical protein [Patescibacteria group bacterium]